MLTSIAPAYTTIDQFILEASTGICAGQKEKKLPMKLYASEIRMRGVPARPRWNWPNGIFSSGVVNRLYSKSPAASAYTLKNEETTSVVNARKAVLEPMLMRANTQLMTAVAAML